MEPCLCPTGAIAQHGAWCRTMPRAHASAYADSGAPLCALWPCMQAHERRQADFIRRVYQFLERCYGSPDAAIRHVAVVSFAEALGDSDSLQATAAAYVQPRVGACMQQVCVRAGRRSCPPAVAVWAAAPELRHGHCWMRGICSHSCSDCAAGCVLWAPPPSAFFNIL